MTHAAASVPVYGVRRFARYRADGRCFEVFILATGECASFPLTRKNGERYCEQLNSMEVGNQ